MGNKITPSMTSSKCNRNRPLLGISFRTQMAGQVFNKTLCHTRTCHSNKWTTITLLCIKTLTSMSSHKPNCKPHQVCSNSISGSMTKIQLLQPQLIIMLQATTMVGYMKLKVRGTLLTCSTMKSSKDSSNCSKSKILIKKRLKTTKISNKIQRIILQRLSTSIL